VLDIGIGYGEIGAFIKRRLTELIIDGIEIWEPYANQRWDTFYRNITIGDFSKIDISDEYDAIWAIAVLEHLPKEEALIQLERLKDLARKLLLVHIPIGEFPQDAVGGNIYETHLSIWSESDLLEKNFSLVGKVTIERPKEYRVTATYMWSKKG